MKKRNEKITEFDVWKVNRNLIRRNRELDEIVKRQQAEIERLRTDLEDFVTEYDAYKEAVDVALAEARAEAIKRGWDYTIFDHPTKKGGE